MDILWQDRKRPIFGLPLSFTKYTLEEKRLFIRTGVFNITEDEVRLYRIVDVTLKRSFGQRIFGIGTIHCCSSDATMKEFDIKSVKKPREVWELLSELIDRQRLHNRVYNREIMDIDENEQEEYDPDDIH